MQRYLLVLDTDLLALDEKLGLEPVNYLVERQEQEPCDVVVLSLADTGQAKLSSLELVLGGASSGIFAPAKFPAAPRPGHDVSAAAEHRMDLTVRHLTAIGCQATGLIQRRGPGAGGGRRDPQPRLRRNHPDDQRPGRQLAGAHPAAGPDPQAAAPLGEEAHRLHHARGQARRVGRPELPGQRNWSYFMLRAAGSGIRRGLLAESGTRAPNGDESDYTGARCTAQYPRALS